MEERSEIGQNKEEIYKMNFRFRQSSSELYRNRRDEDERNKDRSSEESCKI